ncbi:hypothetical protein KR044_005719, partial [Drosophila immigrans]
LKPHQSHRNQQVNKLPTENMKSVKVIKLQPEEWKGHGALELEAAAALLMLRYQYDIKIQTVGCPVAQPVAKPPSPSPPPPPAPDYTTPKDQIRPAVKVASSQPLKKRAIPPHLLNMSVSPSRSTAMETTTITPTDKLHANECNASLLKSCRNMIREFLESQQSF